MAGYDRLSALDRSFLDLEEPTMHMHVGGVSLFEAGPLTLPDGGIDIDRIRAYIEARLHRIPRYRQRIEWIPLENHPVWVDDDRFNLHYHVRHTSLPEPGDERQLKRLCGRIFSQQLDRGKPLWEIWIVEGLEHDRFAMVSKVHHCMIDGVSGTDLMQVLLSLTPEKEFDPPPRWIPNPRPGTTTLVRDAIWRRVQTPLSVVRAAGSALASPRQTWEQASDALGALGETLGAWSGRASETPLNRPIGPHRRIDWLGFDLDEVKKVKNRLGGTVNDVVLATVAGAVSHFLEQRGVSQARQRELEFRVFCPVSVRSASERGTLGNRVASLIARLPLGISDPRERLEAVRKTMGNLKESKQALGAEVLTSVSEWTAPTLISVAARLGYRNRATNMVVTNVPGPQIPLYLLGARMTETYPVIPLFLNHALGIALFSYAGGLFWGFTADWDQLPDLHDFVEHVDAAFHELVSAAEAAEEPATSG